MNRRGRAGMPVWRGLLVWRRRRWRRRPGLAWVPGVVVAVVVEVVIVVVMMVVMTRDGPGV